MRTTTTYLFYLTILWFLVISTHGQSFSTFPSSTTATPTSNSPTRVNEPVDFSTITAWSALPLCLQQQLQLYDGGVAAWIGCNNNFCLCSESFAAAEDQLASDALQECSYVSNMNSATSILSEYCSQHGFTRLLGATSLNTAGIRMCFSSYIGQLDGFSSARQNLNCRCLKLPKLTIFESAASYRADSTIIK